MMLSTDLSTDLSFSLMRNYTRRLFHSKGNQPYFSVGKIAKETV